MDMHELLLVLEHEKQPCVLATVIRTRGHAYRKVGAAMLFTSDGRKYRSISPGCLESDLQQRVSLLLEKDCSELVIYNMEPEEDVMWGEMTGCGGVIEVLLEPVTGTFRQTLDAARIILQEGSTLQVNRSWEGRHWVYSYKPEEAMYPALPADRLEFSNGNTLTSLWTPCPRLVIFGAGADAEPIYELARQAGFRIVIADWRSSLCSAERFPHAELWVGTPEEIVTQLKLSSTDYIVACSHHLRHEQMLLQYALPCKPRYVGIIGSRKRIALLFEDRPIPFNVYAPIGLSIGAQGPFEIAVSIVAQLIAIRSGKEQLDGGIRVYEDTSDLYGGRSEFPNGNSEAVLGVIPRNNAGQYGTSCSLI